MSGFIVEKSFLRYDYYFESWKIGILRFNIFFSVEYFFFFLGGEEWNVAYVSDRFDVILKFLMEEKKNFPPKMMRINAWIVIF